jgi:hypothetical protein
MKQIAVLVIANTTSVSIRLASGMRRRLFHHSSNATAWPSIRRRLSITRCRSGTSVAP